MTKEVMRLKFLQSKLSIQEFDEFFSQNVVMPKGKNRHPYADVLHEWVEGSEIYGRRGQTWGSRNLCIHAFRDDEYRIKLSEPVYEWQWYFGQMFGIDTVTEGFHTEEEIGEFPFRKKEETKRIRQ